MKKCCTRETTGNYCVDGSAAVSFPKLDSVEGGMNISYYGREFALLFFEILHC